MSDCSKIIEFAKPGDSLLLCDDDSYCQYTTAFASEEEFASGLSDSGFDNVDISDVGLFEVSRLKNGLWRHGERGGDLYQVDSADSVTWIRFGGRLNANEWKTINAIDDLDT